MRHLFILAFSCLIPLFAVPRYGWKPLLQCRKAEGNLSFRCPWGRRPVVFLVSDKDGRSIVVTLSPQGMELKEAFEDGRSAELRKVLARTQASPMADLVFKIRENDWSYYVDGVLAASLPAPLALPGSIHWPARAGIKLAVPMRFHPTPRPEYKTDFMIEPGAPNELYPWVPRLGNWHIHTAQQQAVARPETNQLRAKQAPLTADKSPNFYSLKGGGENKDSMITLGYDFYDDYSVSGSFQLDEGEAGVVFLHREQRVENGSEPDPSKADFYALTIRMSRPWHGQRDIRLWKQWQGRRTVLARASVPLYTNQWYLPEVSVHGNEILCTLDGSELFRVKEQLPPGGKVGLFANTQTQIRFDDITLKPYRSFEMDTPEGLAYNRAWHTAEEDFYGRPHNMGLYLTADVLSPAGRFGLLAGWKGKGKPYYRFQTEVKGDSLQTYLLKLPSDSGTPDVLDTYTLPLPASLTLGIDSTDGKTVKCYVNGLLVHAVEQPDVSGCAGTWKPIGSPCSFQGLALSATHDKILELEQKNPVYREDNFMRHWASPEGQWISGGKNLLWHKGDFFGDFYLRMPVLLNTELHLAVPDGKEQGAIVVKVEAGKLTLVNGMNQEKPDIATAPLPDKIVDLCYELVHEGTWLWLKLEGKTVASLRLSRPLKGYGTRVLSKGFGLNDMKRSKVTRTNVLDDFFYESPHAWLTNGGDWQIINRFQCTPSWSHMIAEAVDGLGALWLKKRFHGDMVLEFYAGTRHEHYDQAGNLNCTIMADSTTPSQGYTVACTEWDHNHSQNWSTFYRNGEAMKKTDAYLVPRRRKGMYRKILNPLISQGRPYHGAWFYIKLRKIGQKLEYYFDDELIFTLTDEKAIQDGMVGIWTFVHSMTLAQIKVTFDQVSPLVLPVKMLPVEDGEPPAPQKDALWTCQDKVSQGTLALSGDGFLLTSNLGGGDMKVLSTQKPLPAKELLGWEFQVRRSPNARFNAFYETGTVDANGAFTKVRSYFHQLSGDGFTDGPWTLTGTTAISDNPETWNKVVVWHPAKYRRADTESHIRFVGFGLEQLDALANGIGGNGPGEFYEIRNLKPILASEVGEKPSYTLDWSRDCQDTICVRPSSAMPDFGSSAPIVKVNGTPLSYTRDNDGVILAPLPRSKDMASLVAAGKLQVSFDNGSGKAVTAELDCSAATRRNSAPILEKLEGLTAFVRIFETDKEAAGYTLSDRHLTVRRDDGIQGNYLHVKNYRNGARLEAAFVTSLSAAKYPLLQFRYRAGDMDYISAAFDRRHLTRLTPSDHGSAQAVPFGKDLSFDETWRTWTGFVADAFTSQGFEQGKFLHKQLLFGSMGHPDQTGWFSQLDLDEIVFGPAVSKPEQLAFTPVFFDLDGVKNVQMAQFAGEASWHKLNDAQRSALAWQSFKPGEKISPAFLKDANDGIHHIVIRAEDAKGAVSTPLDIPYLLDRTTLTVSAQVVPTQDPLLNGSLLAVDFMNHGGAPLALEDMTTIVNGKARKLSPAWKSVFSHSNGRDKLILNYPLLFARELSKANNGDTISLELDNLKDGAGNPLPLFKTGVTIDYSKDKQGPSWFNLANENSVLMSRNWDGRQSESRWFGMADNNDMWIYTAANQSPYLMHYTYHGSGELRLSTPKWNVGKYNCISFRASTTTFRKSATAILALSASNKKEYTISLTTPGKGDLELNKTTTYTWDNGKWLFFTFNVKELLMANGMDEASANALDITFLRIARGGTRHRDTLLLDDFAIHGMPVEADKPDTLRWQCFDASGVDCLEVTGLTPDGKDEFTLALPQNGDLNQVRAKFKGTRWLRCRAKDKAGNFSVPCYLPLQNAAK